MVMTIELSLDLQGCTAQGVFNLVYEGTDFLRRYHRELNQDPDAHVGPWVGDTRTLSFTTPLDAPAFIRRLVGRDVMRVNEEQRRSCASDGSIVIVSTPAPDMPGGAKFSTQVQMTFRNVAAAAAAGAGMCGGELASCQIEAVVRCSASGPYGLAGTIEAFMAEAAKKSLQDFFDFLAAYVAQLQQVPEVATEAAPLAAPPIVAPEAAPAAAEAAAAQLPPPAVAAAATEAAVGAAAAGPGRAAETAEQFYDAQELPLPLPRPIMPSGDGLRFEDAALLYLHYMCRTGDQTVGLLQAMEHQVRSLQEKVARLQVAAEQHRRHRRWLPEIPDTVSTRQALLGAALLATTSATITLMWSWRRNAALPPA